MKNYTELKKRKGYELQRNNITNKNSVTRVKNT